MADAPACLSCGTIRRTVTSSIMTTTSIPPPANGETVGASDGTEIPIRADTICIHGDGEHALEFARKIRQTLIEDGIEICPV